MMGKTLEQISVRQMAHLIFISRTVLTVASLPHVTVGGAGRDGWVAAIFNTLLGIPLVWLFIKLASRHPDKSIFEYARDLLGPVAGRLITLPLLWGFLHFAAFTLREYGEMLAGAVLPQTPIVFTMGSMIFVSAVAVRLGIESISRSADILVPLFVATTLGVFVALLPDADFRRLLPVLADGFGPPLRAMFAPFGFYFFLTTLFVIYPSVREKERAMTSAINSEILAGTMITAATAIAIGVLGPGDLGRLQFPFLSLARLVEFAEFFERIETLTIAGWGAGLFLELSITYYAGARGIAQWFGLRDHRRLVFPMGAILLTLSLTLFVNSFQIADFQQMKVIAPYGLAMLFPVPLVLLIASYAKGTREGETSGENGERRRRGRRRRTAGGNGR